MSKKKPNTFFICCSDNRIVSHCFTSKKQDDLFVLRNIGNLIPPHKDSDMAVSSAIEYAVDFFKIPHIIICGHSDCGGMKAALESLENNSSLSNWIKYVVPTNNITSPDELSKENVLHQIKNLMTYPVVTKGISDGTLTIDGWWLDIETDVVYCHDEKTGDWNKI
jgi:carbonic anhydrase